MPSMPPDLQRRDSDRTRFIYGMSGLVIGTVMILAGLAVIMFDVFRQTNDIRMMGFGIGLIMLGGAAALPKTFMPILSAVLKKIPGRGETLKPPEISDIKPEDKEDG